MIYGTEPGQSLSKSGQARGPGSAINLSHEHFIEIFGPLLG